MGRRRGGRTWRLAPFCSVSRLFFCPALWLAIGFLCCLNVLHGQEEDTLSRTDASHDFRFSGLLLPSVAIGYGSAVTFVPKLHPINLSSRDWVQSFAGQNLNSTYKCNTE
ncbi:MAG: hypothetical protein J5873_02905 [Bacteroidales bacterium]|nr:hypothetical protein [Bacteroidales bacterium]